MGGLCAIAGNLSGISNTLGIGESSECAIEGAGLGQSGGSGSSECGKIWGSSIGSSGGLGVVVVLSSGLGGGGSCECGSSGSSGSSGSALGSLSSSLDGGLSGKSSIGTVLQDELSGLIGDGLNVGGVLGVLDGEESGNDSLFGGQVTVFGVIVGLILVGGSFSGVILIQSCPVGQLSS